jgi:hypothetical protein
MQIYYKNNPPHSIKKRKPNPMKIELKTATRISFAKLRFFLLVVISYLRSHKKSLHEEPRHETQANKQKNE